MTGERTFTVVADLSEYGTEGRHTATLNVLALNAEHARLLAAERLRWPAGRITVKEAGNAQAT